MQAVKEKLQDMSAMRKVKSDAKAEEKAEKEIAKARMNVAHEVRLAKEAEAEMEVHVARAGERAEKEIAKHEHSDHQPPTQAVGTDDHNYAGTRAASNDGPPLSTNLTGVPPPSKNKMM